MQAIEQIIKSKGNFTDVEGTALAVSLYRYNAGNEIKLYDTRYDKAIIDSCLSIEEQQKIYSGLTDLSKVAVLRTAEIDFQLLQACGATGSLSNQVVLLGAGLDTRAWRLGWPGDVTIFEIDTGSSENLKISALGSFPLKTKSRHFIKCDLSDRDSLTRRLSAAGHDPNKPTIWLLEGLIGYLERSDGDKLFSTLFDLSSPRSQLIMTCPPNHKDKERALKQGYQLYHQTFEAPESTVERVKRSGWKGRLLHGSDIIAKYKLDADLAQTLVLAHKPETDEKNTSASLLVDLARKMQALPSGMINNVSSFACSYPIASRAAVVSSIALALTVTVRYLPKRTRPTQNMKRAGSSHVLHLR